MSLDTSHKHSLRALNIHEVLVRVFSYNGPRANSRCACVCRQWVEPALDSLWPTLGVEGNSEDYDEDEVEFYPALEELFLLLGPLRMVKVDEWNDSFWTIGDKISSRAWPRFEFYSHRVRMLQIDHRDTMHQDTFRTVGCLKPMHHLLPNLQKLVLNVSECGREVGTHYLKYSVLFLHSGLEHLEVCLPPSDSDGDSNGDDEEWQQTLRDLFDEIIMRSPSISRLQLSFTDRIDTITNELIRLFTQLTSLRELNLPSFALTPVVLASIARLPSIRRICTNRIDLEDEIYDDVCVPFALSRESGFLNLVQISLTGRLVDLYPAFADDSHRFVSLERLEISMLKENPATQVQSTLSTIAQACPKLRVLKLLRDDDHGLTALLQEREQITAACLEPIAHLLHLEAFTLVYNLPVEITDDELVDLIMKFPTSLRELCLATEPLDTSVVPSLTLNVLGKLATRNPSCQLKRIELYVDADYPPERYCLPPGRLLPNLSFLDFGISPLVNSKESVGAVMRYLSKFLPFDTEPERRLRPTEALNNDFEKRRKPWRKVYELLDIAETPVLDDLEWVKEVERRNNDLEAKVRRYEDMLSSTAVVKTS